MNQQEDPSSESEIIVFVRPAERQDCEAIYQLNQVQQQRSQLSIIQSPAKANTVTESQPQQLSRLMTAKELERDGFDTAPPLFHCLVAAAAAADNNDDGRADEEDEHHHRDRREQNQMMNENEKAHNYSHDLASPSPSSSIVVGYAMYFISYPIWEGKSIQLVDFRVGNGQTGAESRKRIGAALLKELAKIALAGGYVDIRLECQPSNAEAVELLEMNGGVDFGAKECWNSFMIDGTKLRLLND